MNNSKKTDPATDADIIDAEVLAEHPAPAPDGAGMSSPARSATSSFMVRAGWTLAFGLATFIGGLVAAPQIEQGLIYFGLQTPPPPPVHGSDIDPAVIRELKASLTRHQEMLAGQEAALQDAAKDRDALKERLDNQPAAGPAQATIAPETLVALQDQVSRLGDDIARLGTMTAQDDPRVGQLTGALTLARAEQAQLKSRLEAVEVALKAVASGQVEASPRGRLVLALGRVRDRAMTGQPFLADLAVLRPDFALLPALDQQRIGADLATLEDHGSGIPAFETLVRDYDAAATAAKQAADKASGNFLTSLFTVRRTDAGATGLDAQLLKAERSLTAHDVAGAIDALAAVDGPAADALKAWRDMAEAHVAVQQAFERLSLLVATTAPATTESQP